MSEVLFGKHIWLRIGGRGGKGISICISPLKSHPIIDALSLLVFSLSLSQGVVIAEDDKQPVCAVLEVCAGLLERCRLALDPE